MCITSCSASPIRKSSRRFSRRWSSTSSACTRRATAGLAKTGKFDYATPVSGFEELDRYTFRIHLHGPFPQLLYWMAHAMRAQPGRARGGRVLRRTSPRRKFAAASFRFYPVGHGPFRMREYTPRRDAALRARRGLSHERFSERRLPAGQGRMAPAICRQAAAAFR